MINQSTKEILNSVISLNPFLKFDARITEIFVNDLFDLVEIFVKESNGNVYYEKCVNEISKFLNVPEKIIIPFLSLMVPAVTLVSTAKLYKKCCVCGETHDFSKRLKCTESDGLFVKTAGGMAMFDFSMSNCVN